MPSTILFQLTLLVLLLTPAWGCGGTPRARQDHGSNKNQMNHTGMTTPIPTLEKWSALIGDSFENIRKKLSASENEFADGRAYQKLKNLTWMHSPNADMAHYYFREGKLLLVYLNEAVPEVKGLRPDELIQSLGTPSDQDYLRSRAGKTATQLAYPEQGIAFSYEGDEVVFVELFAPMPRKEYLETIYEDPGNFGL
jgi:hypothetical protein